MALATFGTRDIPVWYIFVQRSVGNEGGYLATRSKFTVISFLSRLMVGVLSSVLEGRCISFSETGQESRMFCIMWVNCHICINIGDFIEAEMVFVGLS